MDLHLRCSLCAGTVCCRLTAVFWQVTYASTPLASGGPILRSPPGRAIFQQQQLRQIVNPNNTLLNADSFKAFGVLQ